MKNGLLAIFVAILLLSTSCTIDAEKISYGKDACHYCQMTIVDQQHAAQYVTSKGKQFKFDAIECMLNEFSEKTIQNTAIILVADYANPGVMTDANNAIYLISEKIKSPMGDFLSAFSEQETANKFFSSEVDTLYSWISIKEKYSVK